MNDQRGSGLLWALVGCGGLLFVGLCVLLGFGAFYAMKDGRFASGPAAPTAPPTAPPAPVPPSGVPDKPPPVGAPDPLAQPAGEPPFTLEARVTEATGSLAGRVRESCRFAIEQVQGASGPRCRTQVVCDSILVYGGPRAGFFDCRADAARRSVSGSDAQTTGQDGDAAMTVDTDARTLRIEDDAAGPSGAFTLTATIASSL